MKKKNSPQKLLQEISQNTKASQTKKQIVTYYIDNGPSTIMDLARHLNYSIPTVTKIIYELVDHDLVKSYGKLETSGGRQPMLYGLHPDAGAFVGVDVQHTHVNLGLIDLMGTEIYKKMGVPFVLEDKEAKKDELCQIINEFIQESQVDTSQLMNVNINLPGRINPMQGRSYTFFLGSDEESLAEQFSKKLNLFVTIDNDTRGMAYGEFAYGEPAEMGASNVLYLNVSWGLGLGIIIDGKVYTGKSGFSGELGHISSYDNEILCHCGKKGCLQTEISGQALHRIVMERIAKGEMSILSERVANNEHISLDDIIDAIKKEDVLCLEVLELIARRLGRRVAGLINLFNPEILIIGGALSRTGEALRQPLEVVVRTYSLAVVNKDTEIRLATLDEEAGLLGACMLARTRRFELL